MITPELILEEWKKDSVLESDLEKASRNIPRLHSKYLDMLLEVRYQINEKETLHKELLFLKKKHYSGKLSQEELSKLNWSVDPLNGLRVLGKDIYEYVEVDPLVVQSKKNLEKQRLSRELLDSIIQRVSWRSNEIKNIFEWKRFTSGSF